MSTGRIKAYQFITGSLLILNLPLSYLLLKLGYPPESTMYVAIAMALAAHIPRMLYAKKEAGLSLWAYTREVLLSISLVSLVVFLPLMYLYQKTDFGGFGLFVLFSLLCVLWSLLVIYFIGIGKTERKQLAGFVLQKIRKK
jgi:ABC-type transport system involved in cytochrome c biogenesis permease component